MPLLPSVKKQVEKILDDYCEKKIPHSVRDKLWLKTKFRGNSVTLVECRPFYQDPSKIIETVVAQFRFDPGNETWTLYCADRNSRWHLYSLADPSRRLDDLLNEVDADPTGIFWG
jgi:hypothetical protein